MRHAAIIPFFVILAGCADEGLTYADIAKRDGKIAELSDENAKLEKRIAALETRIGLDAAASADGRKQDETSAQAAEKRRTADKLDTDHRFRAIENQ